VVSEGEQLQPGGEFDGEGDDGEPDPVLVEVVQRQVPESGFFGDPDPVLTPCPAAVPQLEVGQLPVGCVGGQGGDAVAVIRSCAPGCGRSLRRMTRIPGRPSGEVQTAGGFGDERPVPDLAVTVVGRLPQLRLVQKGDLVSKLSVRLNPTQYCTRWEVSQASSSWVPPAPSRTSTPRPGRVPGRCAGSCANA
jgi:hypothetical protein